MRTFKNLNGSYDILTANGLLFHVEKWGIRFIGVVNSNWQPNGKLMKRTPTKVLNTFVMEMAKNGRKYQFLLEYYENLKNRETL